MITVTDEGDDMQATATLERARLDGIGTVRPPAVVRDIQWGRAMEEAGVHVVYALPSLKTHAKCILVVRREGDGVRNYVHVGTGNYHPGTARRELVRYLAGKPAAGPGTEPKSEAVA